MSGKIVMEMIHSVLLSSKGNEAIFSAPDLFLGEHKKKTFWF